jgi:AcrR family transcriptional regulator
MQTAAKPATTARRQDILDAALRCFAEKGFGATTMADIRRASGASIGSIYHHFAGKEQLAAALYVEGLRRYQDGYRKVIRAHADDAEGGVKAMVRHHLRWVAGNRDLATFMLTPREPELVLATQAEVRELNRGLFGEIADWLSRHSERELPLELYYTIIIGPSQEFCRHWLAGRTRTPINKAADVLAEAAWDAMKGAAAA